MLFPHATLVVTHAGMGTIMAAFASGVPMLCMPFGRDQAGNAAKVEALNAGKSIAPDVSIEEIRSAVEEILSSDSLRAGAQRMAEIVAGYRSPRSGDRGARESSYFFPIGAEHPCERTHPILKRRSAEFRQSET
jgi:UDP:flavonoid glycosyltransferase YjiC (YdhE family)